MVNVAIAQLLMKARYSAFLQRTGGRPPPPKKPALGTPVVLVRPNPVRALPPAPPPELVLTAAQIAAQGKRDRKAARVRENNS